MNWDVLDRNLRLGSEGKDLGNGVECFRAKGKNQMGKNRRKVLMP